MPACANGAQPTPTAAGTQHLLEVTGLSTIVADLIQRYAPTALATFATSMADVNQLCALNPDPPAALTELDFVRNLTYLATPLASQNLITQYIFEWLQYQAFTQFCVCTPVTVNPSLNCLHATNVTIPSGSQQIVPLGTVQIQPEVYNTWPTDSSGEQTIRFTQHKVTISGGANSSNWFVQYDHGGGSWIDLWRGDGFPEGTTTTSQFTLNAASSPFPRNAPLRIRTDFGAAGQLANLDLCFVPFDQVVPPLPNQPDLPNVPVVPPPTCSTDQLCEIVLELGRQLTRVSAQVADIQAAVVGTDTFTVLSSQPISGEGEATLAVGTRAVSIELTTIGPGVFTSALGNPRGLMRAGSIRFGDGEGFSKRQFIDADEFTRPRPAGALTVTWQLINGCAGTLHFLG